MNKENLLPVQTSSVKHLAFDLVDTVMQQNYVIRDMLKGEPLRHAAATVLAVARPPMCVP